MYTKAETRDTLPRKKTKNLPKIKNQRNVRRASPHLKVSLCIICRIFVFIRVMEKGKEGGVKIAWENRRAFKELGKPKEGVCVLSYAASASFSYSTSARKRSPQPTRETARVRKTDIHRYIYTYT